MVCFHLFLNTSMKMYTHVSAITPCWASLCCAALRCASLHSAALHRAACTAVRFASLRHAALRRAAPRYATLRCASMRSALLRCAPLRYYTGILVNRTCKREPIHNAQFCFQTFRLALKRTVIDKKLETRLCVLFWNCILCQGKSTHCLRRCWQALHFASIHCTALRSTALRCAALHCATQCCTVPRSAAPLRNAAPCRAPLRSTAPLRYMKLRSAGLRYAALL